MSALATNRWAIVLAATIMAGDLVTKYFIEAVLTGLGRGIPVTSFFNLALGYNRGISFGLFASDSIYSPYVMSAIALLIAASLTVWLWRNDHLLQKFGLAAIVGGAIGNAIDRLEDGVVTDFLDFYLGTYHWPAFNLADAAIVCGVGALLIGSLRERPQTTPSTR
ncbi:MAG: signal peptidase II [Alphaproteobacteria bacterium]